MKIRRFHILMFVTLVVTNVLWLDLFRSHSFESWRYLDRSQISFDDFAEEQQHFDSLGGLEERYEFHWPPSQGSGFTVKINKSELKNDRYLVAITNLCILAAWAIGTAMLAKWQRKPEPGTPPNSGPAMHPGNPGAGGGPPAVA